MAKRLGSAVLLLVAASIRVQLRATTGSSHTTSFRVDDVSLR